MRGLIVSSRKESFQHFKKPCAHEHGPIKTLLEAVKDIKPTVLIGSSGVGKTFTKDSRGLLKPWHPLTRNLSFLLSPTQPHNPSVQLKKLIHRVRVEQSLLVEAHLILLNIMGQCVCLDRQTMLTYSLDWVWV